MGGVWNVDSAHSLPIIIGCRDYSGSADPLALTIDLSHAGTTMGGRTSTISHVSLPRRVMTAHVSNINGFHADLTVSLDLRGLPEGRIISRPLEGIRRHIVPANSALG